MPTRGTTPIDYAKWRSQGISIHVPTRGTTRRRCIIQWRRIFQSTCPRGARLHNQSLSLPNQISIHVPTRGTTVSGMWDSVPWQFQSTCPRGARRYAVIHDCNTVYFNPRAHEGHDYYTTATFTLQAISIHVPTRGTTRKHNRVLPDQRFQSTCPRGARRLCQVLCPTGRPHFNPRAHEGHDLHYFMRATCKRFQSTCPRGARRKIQFGRVVVRISIHVPTRGTTMSEEKWSRSLYFNPRAHEGHDFLAYILAYILSISIHVPTRGTTGC